MKKKLLALALSGGLLVHAASGAMAAGPAEFTDLPVDWSRPAIEQAVENGLLQGSDGKIDAYGTLTRSQMAAIMVRAFGATAKVDLSGYGDVSTDAWYYDDMAKAVAMGVFQGADGKLNPEAPITRQEAFTVLARAFVLTGADEAALADFEDDDQVASWAKEAVAALVSGGYVKGSDGKVMPVATMTRAEFAQMVSNLVAAFDAPEGNIEGNVVLRRGEVLPAGTVIQGDLIAAEGVDLAELDLSGITVTGRVVVRGGASVTLGKDSQVGGVVVANTQAPVSVTNDSGSNVDVTVAGSKEVTLNGGYGKVEVSESNAAVILADAKADQVLVSGADAEITVSKDAQVKEVTVSSGADNAAVEVRGKADKVTTAASGTEVSGTGKVSKVEAQAGSEGAKVTTPNTSITVDKEAGAVETAKGIVEPGKTGSSSQAKPSDNSSGSTPAPAATDVIYNGRVTAPILMDAAYANSEADQYAQRTYTQIKRAVGDLRQDIAMVTGAIDFEDIQQLFVDDDALQAQRLAAADQKKVPALVTDTTGLDLDYAIIVGAIDDSPILQSIINAGKLPEAETIQGKWEAYVIKEVEAPIPGVKNALVIAGADARGAIYGIYTISEEIGVSPWYWYSDVPVKAQSTIDVDYTTALVDDGPDVKYRGIFINDEEYSNLWAKGKFPTENGTPEVNYYRRLFEVVLRLKADTLWPGMHNVSTAFNSAVGEDGVTPINAEEAAKYGVIMGTSHCEIMLRNNVGEWHEWARANGHSESYDFSTNEKALLAYWKDRLEANQEFEGILTLGIRGEHDGAFQCANRDKKDANGNYIYPGDTPAQRNVSFMKDVIIKQRQIIAEVYGSADAVPQVVIPYKEMGTVYNDGLNVFLRQEEYEDIMLMWAEDNFGYLRQVPDEAENARSGGKGIYYHSSYMSWTNPKSWLFLNSIQLSLMSEQMHRAYDTGAKDYWILNVGDLKPGDIPAEYFLKFAWDIEGYDDTDIPAFLTQWGIKNYGLSGQDAQTMAEVMDQFYQLTGTKRIEFFGDTNSNKTDDAKVFFTESMIFPFSVTAMGDEGQRLVDQCNDMVDAMTDIYDRLDPAAKDAFYEQVYFHVLTYRDVAEEYVYYWKNKTYADQGRYNSARLYATLSQEAVDRLNEHTHRYWEINEGKWNRVINVDHNIGGNEYVNNPQGMITLDESRYTYPEAADGIGAACEGNGTLRLSALSDDIRYFDVFSKNAGAERWVAEVPAWVTLSKASGVTSSEDRVLVTIDDWSLVSGTQNGDIKVYLADETGAKTGEAVATFPVTAVNDAAFDYGDKKGYVEANGYVMIEAEHYSQNIPGKDGSFWGMIKSNAQRGDTMKALPDTAARIDSNFNDSAKLVYDVYFTSTGTFNGEFYRVPTLNEGGDKTARTAIGLDDQVPTEANLKGTANYNESAAWQKNIMHMIESKPFTIEVNEPGWHQIVVYRSNASIVFDRILIKTQPGAVADSLVGPEESPNNIATVQKHGVGEIPAYIRSMTVLEDVTLDSREVKTLEDLAGVVEVTSGDPVAVQARVQEGRVVLTAGKTGESRIVAVLDDDSMISFNAKVRFVPLENPQDGAYIPENGRILIDAVDATEQTEFASHTGNSTGKNWEQRDRGMQLLPDSGSKWESKNDTMMTNAPCITFQVYLSDVSEETPWYLQVNTSNPNDGSDSYHVMVNGHYVYTNNEDVMVAKEAWFNRDDRYGALNKSGFLQKGYNTITICPREDGFLLNQLLLTNIKYDTLIGIQAPTPRREPAPVLRMDALPNLMLSSAETAQVQVSVELIRGEGAVRLVAGSDDEGVAAVSSVSEGGFTVTPVGPGTAAITVTASADLADCEPASQTFTVTVYDAEAAVGAYLPRRDSTYLWNAVDALEDSANAKHDDVDHNNKYPNTTFEWVSLSEDGQAGTSLQLTPIADANNKKEWPDATTQSPSLTYRVFVPVAGTYYLSVFSNSPNVNSDSFHFGVNGVHQYISKLQVTNGHNSEGDTEGPGWYIYGKISVSLHQGYNDINIWARESGILLRQLMLTPQVPGVPNGWQEPGNVIPSVFVEPAADLPEPPPAEEDEEITPADPEIPDEAQAPVPEIEADVPDGTQPEEEKAPESPEGPAPTPGEEPPEEFQV